ncbi:two component transcriptional regulator, LytTR family [Flavobacteriaceae bacterium MAR_2010_188]|nr:two component transcriptional regulator, LytTR family [Flavobacteriaceae bacterium MAR_2010_188]
MPSPLKILIVEDEMIIGANISLQLSNLGYEVTGILPRGEDAIPQIKENRPDIVLLDIQLKGDYDGIETAEKIQEIGNIPIIFLTANSDEEHFNRAKKTNPYAFISKPFKKLDLQHAIELTANRLFLERNRSSKTDVDRQSEEDAYVLNDSIFVKHREFMVKLLIKDINYIEADRNYCRVYTNAKEYLLSSTLKDLDEKLPQEHFLRIHRSYIVNIANIEEVGFVHVKIGKKKIPISKNLRENLVKRLQTI